MYTYISYFFGFFAIREVFMLFVKKKNEAR